MQRTVALPGILAPASAWTGRWAAALRRVLYEHRIYLAIIGFYYVCAWAAAWAWDSTHVFDTRLMGEGYVLILGTFGVSVAIGHALWAMIWVRPTGSLVRFIARDFRERYLDPDRVASFLVATAPLTLFISVFSSLKRMIPYVNPYQWDPAFAEWDRWLHLGRHPWEWLQPLLAEPAITSFINAAYHTWFFALFFAFAWQAGRVCDRATRMQFLLSFLLCWILLGTVFATAFASGGPVYYGRLTGLDDPYVPLFAYLYGAAEFVPVWALEVQEILWSNYVHRSTRLGSGISAMPSMHVAIAVLLACMGWRVNRWAGWAFTAFAAVVLVGSVHLGWHYAIDGYVSIPLVLLIWWGCGKAVMAFGPSGSLRQAHCADMSRARPH